MAINPDILLGIGGSFALLYACVIIFGWAMTRRNRRIVRRTEGTSRVATLVLDPSVTEVPQYIDTVSLANNQFVDPDGKSIDIGRYTPYIAVGESSEYPAVKSGDLILVDDTGHIAYSFTVPDLSNLR